MRLARLRAFETTLGRKPVASAIRRLHGRGVHQQQRNGSEERESDSHERELKVYRSGG